MGTQIKLNDLKKAGKKLNIVLYGDEIEDHEIDVKLDETALKNQLIKAIGQLEEGEEDELNHEVTEDVIKALIEEFGDPRIENDKAPEKGKSNDLTLIEQIEEIDDLVKLKKLIKEDDALKPLRKSIGIRKDLEKLKEKALKILSDEQTNPEVKKIKKDKIDKSPEKIKEAKSFNRVEACCLALLNKPKTFEDWIEEADEIMEEKGGKPNPKEAKSQCIKIELMSRHFDLSVKVPKLK